MPAQNREDCTGQVMWLHPDLRRRASGLGEFWRVNRSVNIRHVSIE